MEQETDVLAASLAITERLASIFTVPRGCVHLLWELSAAREPHDASDVYVVIMSLIPLLPEGRDPREQIIPGFGFCEICHNPSEIHSEGIDCDDLCRRCYQTELCKQCHVRPLPKASLYACCASGLLFPHCFG